MESAQLALQLESGRYLATARSTDIDGNQRRVRDGKPL